MWGLSIMFMIKLAFDIFVEPVVVVTGRVESLCVRVRRKLTIILRSKIRFVYLEFDISSVVTTIAGLSSSIFFEIYGTELE